MTWVTTFRVLTFSVFWALDVGVIPASGKVMTRTSRRSNRVALRRFMKTRYGSIRSKLGGGEHCAQRSTGLEIRMCGRKRTSHGSNRRLISWKQGSGVGGITGQSGVREDTMLGEGFLAKERIDGDQRTIVDGV